MSNRLEWFQFKSSLGINYTGLVENYRLFEIKSAPSCQFESGVQYVLYDYLPRYEGSIGVEKRYSTLDAAKSVAASSLRNWMRTLKMRFVEDCDGEESE